MNQTLSAILPLAKKVGYWSAAFAVAILGILIFVHNAKFFTTTNVGFLLTKSSEILTGTLYLPAFYGHITTGSIVLLAGLFQFTSHPKNKILHRTFGKVYIFLVVFITAPAGLVMGYYANGGLTTKVSFVLLSVLWWLFTLQAWRKVKEGDYTAHRAFMIRSYALTLSAVMLRLDTFLAAWIFGLRGHEVYDVIVWLSWVPNLIIVEVYFRFTQLKIRQIFVKV